MRKKRLAIKSLLLPFLTIFLSSCAANGNHFSFGDRDSFSYNTPSRSSNVEDEDTYVRGERIFDAFYDTQDYETNYKNRTTPLYLRDFDGLGFTLNNNGYYQVTLNIEGNPYKVDNIASLYVADINFDNHKDLCIGKRIDSGDTCYAAYAYDVYSGKELFEYQELGQADTGGHDYVYNIRDKFLVIESSYSCNPIAINSIGYFKKNTQKETEIDWHKVNFEIIDLEEEFHGARKFKGSDGVERYIVNTEDLYEELYIFINFIGDFSTSVYTEADVYFSQAFGYAIEITHKFIDNLVFSLKFMTEGRYDIVFRVGTHSLTLHFEANNELYEMLQVA